MWIYLSDKEVELLKSLLEKIEGPNYLPSEKEEDSEEDSATPLFPAFEEEDVDEVNDEENGDEFGQRDCEPEGLDQEFLTHSQRKALMAVARSSDDCTDVFFSGNALIVKHWDNRLKRNKTTAINTMKDAVELYGEKIISILRAQ